MRKMKPGLMIAGVGIFCLALFVPLARAEGMKFGVKLSGGINYLSGGDVNEGLMGLDNYWNDFARDYGFTLSGEFKKIQYGLDMQGDLIIYLAPRFGVSISSGYILGKKDSDAVTMNSPSRNISRTGDDQISAIPILISLILDFPISSRSRVFIQAGGGYYLAKYSQSGEYSEEGDYNFSEEWTEKASANGIGFHAGVGLEFGIARNVAFVVEGYGRQARVERFDGNWDYRNSEGWDETGPGTLYYYEWQDSSSGTWYPSADMAGDLPSGSNVRNARVAKIDFSGFAVRAGIKIVF